MDEPMKEIAWQAFANHDGGVERSMFAACEAVLAEAQRREAPVEKEQQMPFWVIERFENGTSAGYWNGGSSRSFMNDIDSAVQFCRHQDALPICSSWHWKDCQIVEHMYIQRSAPKPESQEQTPVEKDRCVHGVDVSAACYQGLCYRPNPPVEMQPAPADDVVERIPSDLRARYGLAKSQLSVLPPEPSHGDDVYSGLRWQCREVIELIERIDSEVAVAREGYVPAQQVKVLQEAQANHDWWVKRAGELEQQLATMYTLEQVETAIRDEFNACSYATSYLEGESRAFGVNVRTRLARLARLAAPKPTEQEKVEAILVAALKKLSTLGNGEYPGNSIGNEIAQKALTDAIRLHEELAALKGGSDGR